MRLATRAWITAARAGRRLRRRHAPDRRVRRSRWVAEHAEGRSFADIGGLFLVEGEMAFQAERAGASAVTLFDAGDAVLTGFAKKHEERRSKIRFVQGNLEDPEAIGQIGVHDVVWCTGVLYHTPNPVHQLMMLREITGELLYLGTHAIPEVPGLENACVYYPGMSDDSRAAYSAAHENPDALWGIGRPFVDTPMYGYGNFWWGMTRSALRAMLYTARFEVVEEFVDLKTPFFLDVVARPLDKDPVLPPVSYYSERGAARARGEEPPPFEGYYEWVRERKT